MLIKIYSFLNPKEKKAIIVLIILMFCTMILEFAGISLIIPLVNGITNTNDDHSKQASLGIMKLLAKVLPNGIAKNFSLILALFFCTYLLKLFFNLLLGWKQSKFIFELEAGFSSLLFSNYLKHDYSFFLKNNSSFLIKNITVLVKQLNDYMLSLVVILSEGLILVGIAFFLFYIEPVGSFVILVIMGLITFLFQKVLKKYLSRWGKSFEYSAGMRLHFLQEGFSAVKEIKLLGRETYFLDKFSDSNKLFTNVGQRYQTAQFIPKSWLEMTAVSSIVLFVLILFFQHKEPASILLTLSIFAASTFKLIPSLSRIVGSYQTILYTKNSVKLLLEEIESSTISDMSNDNKEINFKKEIRLENVCFRYENTEKLILNNLTVTIPCNSFVGIVGTTGEGKSTFVDIILGLLTPNSGKILIDNDPIDQSRKVWQSKIGYVPQTIVLVDDTIEKNIAFGIEEADINYTALNKAIEYSHLSEFISSLPDGAKAKVGERGVRLSGGQRQRIGIARALYANPEILVLDEATSSLDIATERKIMDEIHEFKNKRTIIVIAHRTNTLEKCDLIYKLSQGKIEEVKSTQINK